MTVTASQLAAYVGASSADLGHVTECLDAAAALIAQRTRGAEIPPAVLDLATREVGADLFHRRATRNGVAGFDGAGDVQPVRITRDPMRAADDILAPYTLQGLA